MYKTILGCSVLMLTVAAAPATTTATGAAATAANQAAAVASQAQDVQAAAEKKQCKQLPSSYSRRTQRVCLTAKEWAQVERDAQ